MLGSNLFEGPLFDFLPASRAVCEVNFDIFLFLYQNYPKRDGIQKLVFNIRG